MKYRKILITTPQGQEIAKYVNPEFMTHSKAGVLPIGTVANDKGQAHLSGIQLLSINANHVVYAAALKDGTEVNLKVYQ